MELHTLGVDGGYTQQDVVNVRARVHGLDDRRAAPRRASTRGSTTTAKIVLGHKIKAAAASPTASRCSILAKHPSTARFIATKLARR